jgi:hypothetical protein
MRMSSLVLKSCGKPRSAPHQTGANLRVRIPSTCFYPMHSQKTLDISKISMSVNRIVHFICKRIWSKAYSFPAARVLKRISRECPPPLRPHKHSVGLISYDSLLKGPDRYDVCGVISITSWARSAKSTAASSIVYQIGLYPKFIIPSKTVSSFLLGCDIYEVTRYAISPFVFTFTPAVNDV